MFGLTPYERRNTLGAHDPFMAMFSMNPFKEIENMSKAFDSYFNGNGMMNMTNVKTDIRDNGSEYILEADMPGFAKDDIKLKLKDDILTITAERNSEDSEEKDGYIRRERSYGSFTRSFDVSEIEKKDIKANYKDGVLKLTLPKLQKTETDTEAEINIE